MTAKRNPVCPYCSCPAELVGGNVIYLHRPDFSRKRFWLCVPCDAYVGCHAGGDGTRPLGRLADAQLRAAKQAAHLAFDPLWHVRPKRSKKRREAYVWLAEKLGVPVAHCHIGEFDIETCQRVIEICESR